MIRCNGCKNTLGPECFGLNKRTGCPLKSCMSCGLKYKAYRESPKGRAIAKTANAKYFKTDKGKAFMKKRNADPAVKACKAVHSRLPNSIAVQKQGAQKHYKTEKYLQTKAKWRATPKGVANTRRQTKARTEKLRNDPAARLAWNMRVRLYNILKGTLRKSATFFSHASVSCSSELIAHFREQLTGNMTLENYGAVWHVDHAIPVSAYDHSNAEDVRCCWHCRNLQPMLGPENSSKSNKVIPSVCMAVGADYWPEAWGGRGPWAA